LEQVYEACGKRHEAGEYYQKAADFARTMPGFDPETVERFLLKTKKFREEAK